MSTESKLAVHPIHIFRENKVHVYMN